MSDQNTPPLSFYDGRDFLITTPDLTAPDAGYITPLDSAGFPMTAPVRISGADKGPNHRYVLDPKNTGHAEDYDYAGPVIGEELDRFLAAPEPLEAPILAKGRVPDPTLGPDIIQSGSTLTQAHPPADAPTSATPAVAPVTPAVSAPAHAVIPAKHANALVAFVEALPHDVAQATKGAVRGAEEAFAFLKRKL